MVVMVTIVMVILVIVVLIMTGNDVFLVILGMVMAIDVAIMVIMEFLCCALFIEL